MDLNEKWNTKAGESSKGEHVVSLIKGSNFIDKRNAAFLIYFDFSKENDIVLPWRLV